MMMQMERLLSHCDMELMKVAMLRQEETFRQQVHELHRLYRVQKQLMMTTSCRRQIIRRKHHPRRVLDLHLPADEYIVVRAATPLIEDELELTLAVGGGRRRRRGDDDSAAATTPLAAASDCTSGGGGAGSRSSSSTDTSSGSPYQRAVVTRQQQPTAPWLARCLSLRMA